VSRIVEEPVTSLAFCWRLERPDGGGLGITSHDSPIAIGDDLFQSSPGMVPAAVTHSLGLDPSSTEIAGALSSDGLSDADLAMGRWDGAGVSLMVVDWRAPELAPITLVQGELGDATTKGEAFTSELRGAASKLNEPACPSTSPHCRAELGDKACRVDLAGRSRRVVAVTCDGSEIEVDGAVDTTFLFGRLRYLSGANRGRDTVILGVDGSRLRLRDLPRADIAPGTAIEIREGCDKRLQTCSERFENAVNFRGEPHLPGMDLLTRYPGS
jgi:uncharacterized phage protein (TIGR02218 family)